MSCIASGSFGTYFSEYFPRLSVLWASNDTAQSLVCPHKKEWFESGEGDGDIRRLNAGADYLPLHAALEIRTLARLDSDAAV